MVPYVYDFAEGGRDQVDLLGGKGANLAEMTGLGLPVPPGFIVSTEACRAFLATGTEPEGLFKEVSRHLPDIEAGAGRRLGQPDDPLLVSVRSGARFSMPGMMETVLDIGLNDDFVLGLAKVSGSERFAWDSCRRLVQMFGSTVMGVDAALFDRMMTQLRERRGVPDDLHLDAADLAELTEAYKQLVHEETGDHFPQLPAEQLRRAVLAVFGSWNGDRARLYRRHEHIPDDLGTAVTVQQMVYGNFGPDSGSGVAFTRDPATGRPGLYGDYLPNAQGEDVVSGIRNTVSLADLEHLDPHSYRQLRGHMRTLERHYRDLCDIEFTIERGTLWMLQTRVGKRTAEAAFTIAAELAGEGLITATEGLARVSGDGLARLMFPRFDTSATGDPLAHGIPASPGAAVGAAVFDSAEAVRRAAAGEKVVLVRQETTPDDLPGMVAAQAVLTSRGGKTSHAAVVAPGLAGRRRTADPPPPVRGACTARRPVSRRAAASKANSITEASRWSMSRPGGGRGRSSGVEVGNRRLRNRPGQTAVARTDCAEKGQVPGSGSTAQRNAMAYWIRQYQLACAPGQVACNPLGSGAGVAWFTRGATAFGGSDSLVGPEDTKPPEAVVRAAEPSTCRWSVAPSRSASSFTLRLRGVRRSHGPRRGQAVRRR